MSTTVALLEKESYQKYTTNPDGTDNQKTFIRNRVINTIAVSDEDSKIDGVISEEKTKAFVSTITDYDQSMIVVINGAKKYQFLNIGCFYDFELDGFYSPQRFENTTLNPITMDWDYPTPEPKVTEDQYTEGTSARYIWVDVLYELVGQGWQFVEYPGVPENSVENCYVVSIEPSDTNAFFLNGERAPSISIVRGKNLRFNLVSGSLLDKTFGIYADSDCTQAYTTNVTTTGTPGLADSEALIKILINADTPDILYYGNGTKVGGTILTLYK